MFPADLARLRRKTLIDIAKRRQRPGSGSIRVELTGASPKSWPELTAVLADIPWAIVGAVATRSYMPERATRDLDIVVLAADSERARQRLAAAGFKLQGRLSIGGYSWLAPDGTPVDVIEGYETWWTPALSEAAGNQDARGSRVLTLPYLVLMKLQASRVQDIADVTRMLGAAGEADLQRVCDIVGRQAPGLIEDLESLIELGKLEAEE